MNFLTDIDLTDAHLETAATCVQNWCTATRTDPESIQARGAANVAIELMPSTSTLTTLELLELLLFRLPAK